VIRRSPRLASGERALAVAVTADGSTLAGSRSALHLGDLRVPWESVEKADWDSESGVLTVAEVGTWGEPRPVHVVAVSEAGLLLQLVRERVTASVVLQRHVVVRGRRGFFVIARRAPGQDGPVQWFFEYDEGVDPDDPLVRRRAEAALAAARDDVGLP
jgi:hypothetical protein